MNDMFRGNKQALQRMGATALTISRIIIITLFSAACSSSRIVEMATELPAPHEKAGDVYFEQTTYSADGVTYQAQIGAILVPENRQKPDSRLIRLPLMRIFSKNKSEEPPIFYLTGGPGVSNMKFNPASDLLKNHDVVMLGYRGVDGASRLDCPEIEEVIGNSKNILSEKALQMLNHAMVRDFARLQAQGTDLEGYTIVEVMHDLADAGKSLGYEKINLLSESYGTRIALIYAAAFPERTHRSVMLGANPPGRFVWEADMVDKQIRQYAKLYAESGEPDALPKNLAGVLKEISRNMPERWMGFSIDPGKVKVMTFVFLFHRQTAAMIFDAYLSAAAGDASGLALLSQAYDFAIPSMFVWGDFLLKAYTADFNPARNYQTELSPDSSIIGSPLSLYFWAAAPDSLPLIPKRYRLPQQSDAETLILSGNLDFSTPAEYAEREMLPYLKNGKQIIFSDYGHVNDLWKIKDMNMPNLISMYFLTGETMQFETVQTKPDFDVSFGLTSIAKSILILGSVLLILPLAVLAFKIF